MSAEIKTDMAIQEPHKSKRLSSFIWILVLWGFVRLIAGMDGLSWTRAFSGISIWFGLWPATCLLFLAILPQAHKHQLLFRRSAFFMVIGSFISGVALAQTVGDIQEIYFIAVQCFVLTFVILGAAFHSKLRRGSP